VLEELSQIRSIDVVLPTREGVDIRTRCVTKPTAHQAILLHHLGLTLPQSLQQAILLHHLGLTLPQSLQQTEL